MYANVGGSDAPLEWPEAARRKRVAFWFHLMALLLFVVVDLPWLLLNSRFVGEMIQNIQGAPLTFRAWAAIPVYFALSYLASKPNSAQEAFCMGLCVYAVYDFTNLSTLDGWSWQFALPDSVWGGVLNAIVYSILTSPTVARWLN